MHAYMYTYIHEDEDNDVRKMFLTAVAVTAVAARSFKKLFRCPEWWQNKEKLRLNVSPGALRWSFWLRNASVETHGAHFGSFKSKLVIWHNFVTYFSCQK